jgi:hypothetical protein
MGDLTEQEIFDCIGTNARLAAEHCDTLAKTPQEGETYEALRNNLILIEGACRQASAWRGDTRWLPLGQKMADAEKLVGEWLRGRKVGGIRVALAPRHVFECFTMLATMLRGAAEGMKRLQHERTNRSGLILPEVLEGPHRDTRPVGFTRSMGGVIIPEASALQ